jgi:hypothetical protein
MARRVSKPTRPSMAPRFMKIDRVEPPTQTRSMSAFYRAPMSENEPTVYPEHIRITHVPAAWARSARRKNKGGLSGAITSCPTVSNAFRSF